MLVHFYLCNAATFPYHAKKKKLRLALLFLTH